MSVKSKVNNIFKVLKEKNPNPKTELEYSSVFTLLVAVVLSAQSTDKGVNAVTRKLFKEANTPQKMVELGEKKIKKLISKIGLFNTKSIYCNSRVIKKSIMAPMISVTKSKNINKFQVENNYLKIIPKWAMKNAHHWLILHGRYVCKARNPLCNECGISKFCEFFKKEKIYE